MCGFVTLKSSNMLSCPFSEALTGWAVLLGLPKPPYWNVYALRDSVHMSYSQLTISGEKSWCGEGLQDWLGKKCLEGNTCRGSDPPQEGCQPLLLHSPVLCLGVGPAWVGSWLFLLNSGSPHPKELLASWDSEFREAYHISSLWSFPSFLGLPLPLQDII